MSRIKVDALQGTSGSDTAITLSGANATVGGTLAVTGIHTVGNNAIYTSDGGAVTQNLVQGIAKAWGNAPGNATSINDSFNVASLTDTEAGDMRYNLTNNMSATEYSFTVGHQYSSVLGTGAFFDNPITGETSSFRMQHYENGSKADAHKYSGGTLHGDLA